MMDGDEFSVVRQPAHHERRFRRLFRNVPTTEVLLCRFSCAYVSDLGLLLQGHLYVSDNWICFHSNVFGIEKIIEIPVESVVTVSKAHTAKIIPNAVKIKTQGKYYLFGSLISRDNTYRLLISITARWKGHAADAEQMVARAEATNKARVDERTCSIEGAEEDVSSLSSASSTNTTDTSCGAVDGRPAFVLATAADGSETLVAQPLLEKNFYNLNNNTAEMSFFRNACQGDAVHRILPVLSIRGLITWLYSLPKIFVVLLLCIAILSFLFLCATFLTVRLMYMENPRMFRTSFVSWISAKEKHAHPLPGQTLETMDDILDNTLKMVSEVTSQLERLKFQVRVLMMDVSSAGPRGHPDTPIGDGATV